MCCCPEGQPSALCEEHSQLLEEIEVVELERKRGE